MVNKPIPWTNSEIKLITDKYPTSTKNELKILFPHRSQKSISGKAEKLGLKKCGDLAIKPWMDEKINIIVELYSYCAKDELLEGI